MAQYAVDDVVVVVYSAQGRKPPEHDKESDIFPIHSELLDQTKLHVQMAINNEARAFRIPLPMYTNLSEELESITKTCLERSRFNIKPVFLSKNAKKAVTESVPFHSLTRDFQIMAQWAVDDVVDIAFRLQGRRPPEESQPTEHFIVPHNLLLKASIEVQEAIYDCASSLGMPRPKFSDDNKDLDSIAKTCFEKSRFNIKPVFLPKT